MKKLLLPLIALILVLAACGNNSDSGSKDSDKKQKQSHTKRMMAKQLKYLKILSVLQ